MRHSLCLLVILGLLLAGCTTPGWWRGGTSTAEPPVELADLEEEGPVEAEPGLQPAPQQRFADVPMPMDLREDPRTYVFQSATITVARLVYSTKASEHELAQFFLDQCPTADWVLDSYTQAGGMLLLFKKPGQRLMISIRDLSVTKGRELIIELTPDSN